MKVILRDEHSSILSFAKGEEVISTLLSWVTKEHVSAAHLTGLGAASKLVLAYYNLATKEYEKKKFEEDVEILSLTGNVGVKENGDAAVHMHGVFGKKDFTTFGGHIFEMVISGAGEIHLTTLAGAVARGYDDETGLTLMR